MAKYKREVTEYVLDRVNIVETIGGTVELKRAGRNYKALCPFHNEKTASFVVSQDKQFYHCFGCGQSGNAISFLMDYENMSFLDALETLAERNSIDISGFLESDSTRRSVDETKKYQAIMTMAARLYYTNRLSNAAANDYLTTRGISPETAKKFGLGYASDSWDYLIRALNAQGIDNRDLLSCGLIVKNDNGRFYDRFRHRLMFPIFDRRSRVVAFGGRVLDDALPKYLNSPETHIFHKSNILYGLNFARKVRSAQRRVLLVEGYMDVIALAQHGFHHAVASLGTALTAHHVKQLAHIYDELIFAYDTDQAGRQAIMKSLPLLEKSDLKVRVLQLMSAKDPDEFLRQHSSEAFEAQIAKAIDPLEFSIKHIEASYNMRDGSDKLKFLQESYAFVQKTDQPSKRALLLDYLAERVGLDRAVITEDFTEWQMRRGETRLPRKAVDQAAAQPPADRVQPSTDKLFKLESALLAQALADRSNFQYYEAQAGEFYYRELQLLWQSLRAYYRVESVFDEETAIAYFDIDQLRQINQLIAAVNNELSLRDRQRIVQLHRQYYLQRSVEALDAQLKQYKMSSEAEDQIKYRELLVKRMDLQQDIASIAKGLSQNN